MAFWPFGRKKQTAKKEDPLAAFDGFLEHLERQGAEIRRSAATLLALRAELTRTEEKHQKRIGEVRDRISEAKARGDHKSVEVLERDVLQLQKLVDATRESLARAVSDAELLLEAAQGIGRQVEDLREERASAQARLTAGIAVTETMKQRSAEIAKVLALDAARDEIERAHALAEIYREEKDR
jgi:phage shock protein A